jgi:hypothetical protein
MQLKPYSPRTAYDAAAWALVLKYLPTAGEAETARIIDNTLPHARGCTGREFLQYLKRNRWID